MGISTSASITGLVVLNDFSIPSLVSLPPPTAPKNSMSCQTCDSRQAVRCTGSNHYMGTNKESRSSTSLDRIGPCSLSLPSLRSSTAEVSLLDIRLRHAISDSIAGGVRRIHHARKLWPDGLCTSTTGVHMAQQYAAWTSRADIGFSNSSCG